LAFLTQPSSCLLIMKHIQYTQQHNEGFRTPLERINLG
jgi:hypothetical protein